MSDDELQEFEVFVQWERGKPHTHEEVVNASDAEMAITLAKRNVDVRREPESIWVVPRSEVRATTSDDPTLTPSTERSYRNVEWYASEE